VLKISATATTQILGEVVNLELQAQKQNLMWNSHSGSLKVTCFGINRKLTRDSVSLYNKAGLISSFWRHSKRKHWKLPLSTAPLLFDAASLGMTKNIRISLILLEMRVNNLHMWRRHYGSIFIHFFVVGSKTRIFCAYIPKLESLGYPSVKISWCWLASFWHKKTRNVEKSKLV